MRVGKRLASGPVANGCILMAALAVAGCRPPEPSRPQRVEFEDGPTARVLVSGWSGFERTAAGDSFAWAEGLEARLRFLVPRACPYVIRFRAWPFEYAGAPVQRVTVFVNENRIGRVPMKSGAAEYEMRSPAAVWRNGENVVRLAFGRAERPSDVVAGADDRRALAAALDWLRIEPSR